ncbi:hypothetical protein [Luteimonas deserti]|uniref:Uncharacterized protein n=1 Tax=Luteimonas deserti TaxID=2752306 RepID=A0A7Z0QQA2_9GAMM|nr:hypothetical protein [Luteimonas deserti]NYZ62862.1 hypothetical protein [Luteimonas deserti]
MSSADASIGPGAHLEAALQRFALRPDVAPVQAAALRDALTSDAGLRADYEALAALGQVRDFAPAPASSNLQIGRYDQILGQVTVPADQLDARDARSSTALAGTLRIQQMLAGYAHSQWTDAEQRQQPVSQDMVDNLQATLNGSPALVAQLRLASVASAPTQAAPVRVFESLPGTVHAGGTYNPDTGALAFPPAALHRPPVAFQHDAQARTDLIFVMGHEVQHGLNAAAKQAERLRFIEDITQIARGGGPAYDYTAPLLRYQQAARSDEAKAQIAGWNATQSELQQDSPRATLAEMFDLANRETNRGTQRINDFVVRDDASGQVVPRPGLAFEHDGSLRMTEANIAAVARHYFDKPPEQTRIGHHGDSDYPNYYGADAVTVVIYTHRQLARQADGSTPPIRLDMGQLRLQEVLLERNGLAFPPGSTPLPTGAETDVRQAYLDIGQDPPIVGHFDFTRTPEGTPHRHQHRPIPAPAQAGAASGVSQPETLSGQLDRMLVALETGDARTFQQMIDALAQRPAVQSMQAEAARMLEQQVQANENESRRSSAPPVHAPSAPVMEMR